MSELKKMSRWKKVLWGATVVLYVFMIALLSGCIGYVYFRLSNLLILLSFLVIGIFVASILSIIIHNFSLQKVTFLDSFLMLLWLPLLIFLMNIFSTLPEMFTRRKIHYCNKDWVINYQDRKTETMNQTVEKFVSDSILPNYEYKEFFNVVEPSSLDSFYYTAFYFYDDHHYPDTLSPKAVVVSIDTLGKIYSHQKVIVSSDSLLRNKFFNELHFRILFQKVIKEANKRQQ